MDIASGTVPVGISFSELTDQQKLWVVQCLQRLQARHWVDSDIADWIAGRKVVVYATDASNFRVMGQVSDGKTYRLLFETLITTGSALANWWVSFAFWTPLTNPVTVPLPG